MLPRTWPRIGRKKSAESLHSLNSASSHLTDDSVTNEGGIYNADDFLDDRLPVEYFRQDVIKLIHRLRIPGWSMVTIDMAMELNMSRISGALTNSVYSVKPPRFIKEMIKQEHMGRPYQHKLPPSLLLRVYGPQVDFLIDREKELKTVAELTKHNIGPRLLGTFKNGRFEQFLNAKPLTKEELRNPETSIQIAKRMRDLHLNVPLLPEDKAGGCGVFKNFWKWETAAKERLTKIELKKPGTIQRVMRCSNFDEFLRAMRLYQEYLDKKHHNEKIVFCHNDTQYGNILRLDPPKGSPLLQPQFEHRQLVVIDFEYSGPNVAAFDIANHFCEWMSDYHHPTMPHHIWRDRYPNDEEQTRFISSYVEHGAPVLDETVIEPQVASLKSAVADWRPAVSAFWSMWGIVQTPLEADHEISEEFLETHPDYELSKSPTEHPEIEDEDGFDYLSYASEKLGVFWDDMERLGIMKLLNA